MYTLNSIDSYKISKPADTYVYDIVPVAGGLAAISSDDSLRFLNPLALSGGPTSEIKKVNQNVTCLKAAGEGDAAVLCTAGRDGKVRLIDLRSGLVAGEVCTGELLFVIFFLVFLVALLFHFVLICAVKCKLPSQEYSEEFLAVLHITH